MFLVALAVVDSKGHKTIASIEAVRGEAHPRLKRAYWYSYRATLENNQMFVGKVLHSYDNGAIALTQKLTKAVVAQQKALRKI